MIVTANFLQLVKLPLEMNKVQSNFVGEDEAREEEVAS